MSEYGPAQFVRAVLPANRGRPARRSSIDGRLDDKNDVKQANHDKADSEIRGRSTAGQRQVAAHRAIDPAAPDSPRILFAGLDSDGEPVLRWCHRARRIVGERARQVRRPVEVDRHRAVGLWCGDRK